MNWLGSHCSSIKHVDYSQLFTGHLIVFTQVYLLWFSEIIIVMKVILRNKPVGTTLAMISLMSGVIMAWVTKPSFSWLCWHCFMDLRKQRTDSLTPWWHGASFVVVTVTNHSFKWIYNLHRLQSPLNYLYLYICLCFWTWIYINWLHGLAHHALKSVANSMPFNLERELHLKTSSFVYECNISHSKLVVHPHHS